MAPRSVRLTSPDRVLFPEEGITKEDLFEYYRAVAPVLVPHLRDRPFTMKRRPYGVAGDAYFQKQALKGMPAWIPTRTYRTRRRSGESRLVDFPLVNSPEALLWMVQMNCIDMNAWYSRVDKPDRPDFALFDLDPPDGGFVLAIRVAHLIREELERLELESYVKTSGADGIRVLVPIARRATYDRTYELAERVARGLEERHPGLVTTEWLEAQARGRARRPPSECPGEDDRLGVLGAAEAGRTCLDTASLGRADRGRDAAELRDARGARAGRTARRPVRAGARRWPGTRARAEDVALGAPPPSGVIRRRLVVAPAAVSPGA